MVRKVFGAAFIVVGVLAALSACSGEDGNGDERVGERRERVILVPTNGGVITIAGNGTPGNTGDGSPASAATLNDPAGVAVATDGTIYIAGWGSNSVRQILPNGNIETFVPGRPNLIQNPRAELANTPPSTPGIPGWTIVSGQWISTSKVECTTALCGYPYDGSRWFWGGSVPSAQLTQGIVLSAADVADIQAGGVHGLFHVQMRSLTQETGRVRVDYLDQNNVPVATFDTGERSDPAWTAITADTTLPTVVRKVAVTLFTRALSGAAADSYFDGLQLRLMKSSSPATADRRLTSVAAVAIAPNGEVLVGANDLFIFKPDKTFVANVTSPNRVSSIATVTDGAGYVAYYTDPTNRQLYGRSSTGAHYMLNVDGGANAEPVAVAAMPHPTLSNTHRLWLSYRGFFGVYWYTCPKFTTVNPVTCTFESMKYGHDTTKGFVDDLDGTAGGERFGYPHALSLGKFGEMLIGDEGNHAVRRSLLPFTQTSAGTGVLGFQDGASSQAKFWSPTGLAAHPDGSIVVADRMNNRIRKILCAGSNVCAASAGSSCPVTSIDDQNMCTLDTCNVLAIRRDPVANGSFCTDNNACTLGDSCNAGLCVTGPPVPTNDNNACTTDSCNPATGQVTNTPIPIIPDANPCTTGTCDPATGTVTHPPSPEGTSCGTNRLCSHAAVCEAAAPPAVAPPLSPIVRTPFGDSIKFIYEPPNNVQTGVTANYIDPTHAGWLVGYVKTAAGNPMANVTVSVVGQTKYGQTLTRADGRFDLVVNGGATYTLRFAKAGHFSADRRIYVGWEQTAAFEDVILLTPDSTNSTALVSSSSSQQVAVGSQTTHGGTRQPIVVLPAQTRVHVNGSPTPLANMTMRLTEYTAGPDGEKRMPAPLPPTTAYTFAVEISLDEALAANRIDFKDASGQAKDVFMYLENFIGFPVGEVVPNGYYDRDTAAWIRSKNGLVIKLKTVSGVTSVYVNGDATADAVLTDPQFSSLGFSSAEVSYLATRYATQAATANGVTLWRVPINHLTPYDCNYPADPPDCEGSTCPGPPDPLPPTPPDPDCGGGPAGRDSFQKGSIIGCDSQSLGEKTPVPGTPFALHYSSSRMLGAVGGRQIRIPLTAAQVHSQAAVIKVMVAIAGQRHEQVFTPEAPATTFAPNLAWTFTWDGKDAAGRMVVGSPLASVTVTVAYKGKYVPVEFFGAFPSPTAALVASPRVFASYSVTEVVPLNGLVPDQGWSLGGWTFDQHHFYDSTSGKVFLGSGGTTRARALTGTTKRLWTSLNMPDGSDDGGVAVAPNGDIFVADTGAHVIRRITPTGAVSVVVGDGTSSCATATPNLNDNPTDAALAHLSLPSAIAIGADGSLYIANRSQTGGIVGEATVRKATPLYNAATGLPTGKYGITTIAGKPCQRPCSGGSQNAHTCEAGYPADGLPATSGKLDSPKSIALGPDGSVYLAEYTRVRRIDPQGIITTVAGNGNGGAWGQAINEGKLASQVSLVSTFDDVGKIAVAPDNTLYIATPTRIVRVDPNGVLHYLNAAFDMTKQVASGVPLKNEVITALLQSLTLRPDGTLLFNDSYFGRQQIGNRRGWVRSVDTSGIVTTFTATPDTPTGITEVPPAFGLALGNGFGFAGSMAAAPNGDLIVLSAGNVYGVEVPNARSATGCNDAAAKYQVPSGDQEFCFDANGRHLKTINARTRATLLSFGYTSGVLTGITDVEGKTTSISKLSGANCPATSSSCYQITAHYGQKTTIALDDTTGYAKSIGDSLGQLTLTPLSDGLLDKLVDRKSNLFDFTFTNGFLTSDTSPAGSQTLARTLITNGRLITHKTPLLRQTTYETVIDTDGLLRHTTTFPDFSKEIRSTARDGQGVTTARDGTVTTVGTVFDAGRQRTAPGTTTIKLPSGLTLTTQQVRTAPSTVDGVTTEVVKVLHGAATDAPATTTTASYGTGGANLPGIGAPQQLVITSPKGRARTSLLDAFGRTTSERVGSLTPVVLTFEPLATSEDYRKLKKVAQGTRILGIEYQPQGTGTPPPGAGYVRRIYYPYSMTKFGRDIFGRPTTAVEAELTPLEGITSIGFDLNGLLQSVKPPSSNATPPEHVFAYNGVDLLTSYTPPALAGVFDPKTIYVADADRDITSETRGKLLSTSTPVVVTRTYWENTSTSPGPLKSVTYPANGSLHPAGALDFSYYIVNNTTGAARSRVAKIKGPYTAETTYQYDGRLTTKLAWAVDLVGDVSWTYNDRFLPIKETVSPAPATGSAGYAFGYDDDGLLTCVSADTSAACSTSTLANLVLTRSGDHGMVTDLAVGATKPVKERRDYSDSAPDDGGTTDTDPADQKFGELRQQTLTANGVEVARLTYDAPTERRDDLGRIQFKTEKFGSVTKEIAYGYDERGRLDFVQTDVATESFGYDLNGNRTAYCQGLAAGTPCTTSTAGAIVGIHDAQDRLRDYGAMPLFGAGHLAFTYTANGEMLTKQLMTSPTTTVLWTYGYDPLGNLVTVAFNGPNPVTHTYMVDGRGRRVGKKQTAGATTTIKKRWLYRNHLNPVAELSTTGALIARYVYGSQGNVPDLVVKAGKTYRLFTDHLGSPRMAVNVDDPNDVPYRVDYSAFGVPTWKGTGAAATPAFDWIPFGFAGGIYDHDTGLLRFGARDYDPTIGRWLSKDPIRFRGGINLYVYSWNDPVNFVDRTGRQPIPVPWFGPVLGGAAGGAAVGSLFAGVGAIPGAIIGAILGAAVLSVPGDTPIRGDSCNIRGEGGQLDRIARDQGISRDALRKALEKIKDAAGLRGDENVDILPNGTVVDPVSGDPIGNIHDEQGD